MEDVYTDDKGNTYSEFQLRCLVELFLISHPGLFPQTAEAQEILTEFLVGIAKGPTPMEFLSRFDAQDRETLNQRIKRRTHLVS